MKYVEINGERAPIYKACYKCDKFKTCNVANKYQRLPRYKNGLGLCKYLKEVK